MVQPTECAERRSPVARPVTLPTTLPVALAGTLSPAAVSRTGACRPFYRAPFERVPSGCGPADRLPAGFLADESRPPARSRPAIGAAFGAARRPARPAARVVAGGRGWRFEAWFRPAAAVVLLV